MLHSVLTRSFFFVLRIVSCAYTVVTLPVFVILRYKRLTHNPYRIQHSQSGQIIKNHGRDFVSCHRQYGHSEMYDDAIVRSGVDTVSKAFRYAVKRFQNETLLGTREVLSSRVVSENDGKEFKKWTLGDYKWRTYLEVYDEVLAFGRGLRQLGLVPGQSRLSIYTETRAEWFIASHGAFDQNISITTVYTNLGLDAVVHALNETMCTVVMISHELIGNFLEVAHQIQTLETIIYVQDTSEPSNNDSASSNIKIITYAGVVSLGKSAPESLSSVEANPSDLAVVMYTSGSTGAPKGVMLSHGNLVACITCLMFIVVPDRDVYVSYLPLAHVLELLSENTMAMFGIKIGYSSAQTLTDMSTRVAPGSVGDVSVLRPTMMCTVPLIIDRLFKNINENVKKRGPFFAKVFDYCVEYKRFWRYWDMDTPLVDMLVFNKIKNILGGRLRFMLVGGAPISPYTHDFIRTCLDVPIYQGYSLTESCCAGSVMEYGDLSVGTVGRPMTGVHVRVVDWAEGGYYATEDGKKAQGEICIGGPTVAMGYFEQPALTKDIFFTDKSGIRWVRTGDVGDLDPRTGKLRIIDRKKDLVKLPLGEYVSLGKVESMLKTHHLVDNICLYGDPFKNMVVALVVPSREQLESIGQQLGLTERFEELCQSRKVMQTVLSDLYHFGRNAGLKGFELPSALKLCIEQWTPESGFITAAFKLKRRILQNFYQADIDEMYENCSSSHS